MPKRYCHLNEISFNEHLKQKAGLTTDKIDAEAECPYCHTMNNINAINCNNCKRLVNREELAKRVQQQEERDTQIKNQIYNLNQEIQQYQKKISTWQSWEL